MRTHLAILVMILIACSFGSSAHAASRLVPDTYSTIQSAVDAAASGDEVHITAARTYNEVVTVTDKNLSIIGDVAGVVVNDTINNVGTSVLTLSNLKIYDTSFDGVAQYSTGALTINNCVIDYCVGRGILHMSGGDVNVSGCTVTRNNFDGYDRGSGTGGKLTVSGNCVFANNGRAGIFVEGGTNPVIEINNSEIRNNLTGITVNGPTGATGTSILIADSTFRDNPQDQILFANKVNLVMNNVSLLHTAAPTFMAGVRFDGSAATLAGASTAEFTNCQFTSPFGFPCIWGGHKLNLTLNKCAFNGYSSMITTTDNDTAVATIAMSDTTFKGSTSVPIAFNGVDGKEAHVLTADRCRFTGAATAFNLVNAVAAQATLTNCVFDGGDTQVWSQGDQAWLKARNCTLVGDADTTCGLNFVNDSAEHLVANCIIDNTELGLNGTDGVFVNNHHNLIRARATAFTGITAGASTILDTDPQFVTASTGLGTGDFHLKATSPAIDQGDGSLGVTVDYDNAARSGGIDLGAYELNSAPVNAVEHWVLY